MLVISVILSVFHPDRFRDSNEVQFSKMPKALVTLLVFHPDISGDCNKEQPLNMSYILVTLLVSHTDIPSREVNEEQS